MLARFAYNVEWDFFCDFQTLWYYTSILTSEEKRKDDDKNNTGDRGSSSKLCHEK